MTQVVSVAPWYIDSNLKLSYNRGVSLYELRKKEYMRRSPWYKNLKACLDRAPEDVKINGKQWYQEAQAFAHNITTKYGISIDVVAQVIAALSPATRWERNLIDAQNMIHNYHHCGWAGASATTVCTYGPNKRKAIEILLGKIKLSPDNGLKTYNFFNNIINPLDPAYVTIDRHAFRILEGKTKRGATALNKKTYEKAKNIYLLLAKDVGLTACEIQAITWIQHRNELGIK